MNVIVVNRQTYKVEEQNFKIKFIEMKDKDKIGLCSNRVETESNGEP